MIIWKTYLFYSLKQYLNFELKTQIASNYAYLWHEVIMLEKPKHSGFCLTKLQKYANVFYSLVFHLMIFVSLQPTESANYLLRIS